MNIDRHRIENAVKEILAAIGEDVNRPELLDTPARVACMYEEVFSCTRKDLHDTVSVILEPHGEQMIVVKDITFYSMCEHHLVPFFGKAHIVYIPKENRITGFSKLCTLVESAAKRPQLQERMTTQIADVLMNVLEPQGVMVVIEAEHLCMSMRGVKKPGTKTTTSAIRGLFYEDASARAEALTLIK
ncbi:MAG: GTP cyclohydrolase I FolE [Candidatus Margulisiibacteriota bacterium]|nr:MAG: GTP cyclohydrolase I FolE [Candidatus Margulisbacteria bacterium GWF2_38_17]OGI11791.1 MAG: GTP cyclohydrolase I FolE [Candidatus Margulisbacteria bacterium GWE2_39_32]PZM79838.1 MAG: GTP cyclohydrolase I FolE [Candidatus Margulisiibacteriota bacterium]HCY37581.1 GTP cyclohydrolase I FolE [Candidatus Margulisiibacteriota bacterium]